MVSIEPIHMRLEQPLNILSNRVPDDVSMADIDSKAVILRNAFVKSVIVEKSINGKDVRLEQPFHVLFTEVTAGPSANAGKDVSPVQSDHVETIAVAAGKLVTGKVVRLEHKNQQLVISCALVNVNAGKVVRLVHSRHAKKKLVPDDTSIEGKDVSPLHLYQVL